jgi:hypothetical protein
VSNQGSRGRACAPPSSFNLKAEWTLTFTCYVKMCLRATLWFWASCGGGKGWLFACRIGREDALWESG